MAAGCLSKRSSNAGPRRNTRDPSARTPKTLVFEPGMANDKRPALERAWTLQPAHDGGLMQGFAAMPAHFPESQQDPFLAQNSILKLRLPRFTAFARNDKRSITPQTNTGRLPHFLSAGDVYSLSGHVACLVGSKEDKGIGNIFILSASLQRHLI